MTATSAKKTDLKRWGLVHYHAMRILGYSKKDYDRFWQIGYFIATWVDMTGTFPKTKDFIACKQQIESCPCPYPCP